MLSSSSMSAGHAKLGMMIYIKRDRDRITPPFKTWITHNWLLSLFSEHKVALDSLRCSLTCATCNLSTVLGSLLGLCNATWPRLLPGWAVISQQTASSKAICGHLGHVRNGQSTLSQQDNTRAGECNDKGWHPAPWFPAQLLTRDFWCFFPCKTSRKLPRASENQERWTIKEMELSRCSCTTGSLFHGDCPHFFGHAVQCNWLYFSCFVIIAAAGSDTLYKVNLFSTFTELWPIFLYQNRHKYHGTIFDRNTCVFWLRLINCYWSLVVVKHY